MLDGFWKNLVHYHEILSSLTSLWFLGFCPFGREPDAEASFLVYHGVRTVVGKESKCGRHLELFNFREGTNRLPPVDVVKIQYPLGC